MNQNPNQEKAPKRIAIMGSTGSIGTQALEVIRDNPLSLNQMPLL
jgi:1-deoxy-D-xylulose 5-phosphate reductoisomerase